MRSSSQHQPHQPQPHHHHSSSRTTRLLVRHSRPFKQDWAAAPAPAVAAAAAAPALAPAAAGASAGHPQLLQLRPAQPWQLIIRSCQVAAALLRLAAVTLQHDAASGVGSSGYGAAVRAEVSALGPLWVKLGQTLSVRQDVVGARLAAALAGLQEGAPPFDDTTAAAIIAQELGATPSQLFASFSGPVASASLGQVYKAELPDGTRVAVKVQRPGVLQQLQLDLSILLALLRGVRAAARIQQDITAWADTLACGLAEELDYEREGLNLERFAAAHSHLGFVTTPSVVWQLTSRRVLTTSWLDGVTPGQIIRQARRRPGGRAAAPHTNGSGSSGPPDQQLAQQQLMQLVRLGVEASLAQLVVTRLLHADPHPGNLLLTPQGQLGYLDFGLLVTVPEPAALAMMAGLVHFAVADWLGLANDLSAMGLLKPTTSREQLAADLQQQFEALGSSNSSDGMASGERPSLLLDRAAAIGFADFAAVIARLAVKYRFELPSYFTLVIRSLTTLEGFALEVDSSARRKIVHWAVRAVARQLLSDERPAALQLLQQLLGDDQQPGRLNLPLLEELLLLHQQHNDGSSSSAAIVSSGLRRKQQLGLLSTLIAGLDPQQLAEQLSSPQAFVIRRVLVQELAQRLSPASTPSTTAAAAPACVSAAVFETQQHSGAGHQQQTSNARLQLEGQEQRRQEQQVDVPPAVTESAQPCVLFSRCTQVVIWLLRAGPRGMLLAAQLISLAAAAVVARAVRAIGAVFSRRRRSDDDG